MSKLNLSLWILSVTLQCALLLVLAMRRIVRRLPRFTALIGFYVVRSISLHLLSLRIRPASYQLIFSVLAIVDVLLQVAVAWELFSQASRLGDDRLSRYSEAMRRVTLFCLMILGGGIMAGMLSAVLPLTPRVPIDRGVVLSSTVFVLVFLFSSGRQGSALIRWVAGGFAGYGAFSIAGQIGRTLAASQRNASSFTRWSYAGLAVYLLVVLTWIIALSRVDRSSAEMVSTDVLAA